MQRRVDLMMQIRQMVNVIRKNIHFISYVLFRRNCFDLSIAINIARGEEKLSLTRRVGGRAGAKQ